MNWDQRDHRPAEPETTVEDGIRARLEASTPGEWEPDFYVDVDEDGVFELGRVLAPDPDEPDTAVLVVADGLLRHNANFIARAHEEVPWLLEQLEAERALNLVYARTLTAVLADLEREVGEEPALGADDIRTVLAAGTTR